MADASNDVPAQSLQDGDSTAPSDGTPDAAQAEWEATASGEPADEATATGADPDEIPSPDDEIPAEDLPGFAAQPETQGEAPNVAYLGDEGQGDLSPEDL